MCLRLNQCSRTSLQEGETRGLNISNWLYTLKKKISLEDYNRTLTLIIFKIFRIQNYLVYKEKREMWSIPKGKTMNQMLELSKTLCNHYNYGPSDEKKERKWSGSVTSDSLQPHGLQPARLLHPWDLQARILEWVATSFSRWSSGPRDWTWVSRAAGRLYYLSHQGR